MWDEFEARTTAEAQFANAMDRLMPFLHNYLNDGGAWVEKGIGIAQVRRRIAPIAECSAELGRFIESLLAVCLERGYIRREPEA